MTLASCYLVKGIFKENGVMMKSVRIVFWCLALFFIGYLVFFQKKETESTWAWILVLWNFPLVGILLYFLTGQEFPKEKRKNAKNKIGELTEDNNVRILLSGEEKFAALLQDIREAKKEILLQYYILKDDFLFQTIEELLLKKALQGVEVKILYDALGSRKVKKRRWESLKKKGIKVKVFRSPFLRRIVPGFNYRNHRKIVIIDKYIGYLGGYNLGKEYLGLDARFGFWRDTHLRIVGSAVQSLREVFLKDWGEMREGNQISKGQGGCGVQIVTSSPGTPAPHIRNVYLRLIMAAKEKIWIQTPYFIPDQPVLTALKMALLSGKEVKIMIPCKPDHAFVYWATLFYAGELLEAGAGVYIYENGFLHTKGLIMDEDIYCYGTANMDIRSFRLNYEINALVYGVDEVKKMVEAYKRDLADCTEMKLEEYALRSGRIRIKEQLFRLLSPLL